MTTLKAQAFTILEVLLAMTLASFIMVGIAQIHRGVVRYLDVTRQKMSINRKVCLVFNQIERDISSAFIPFPHSVVDEKNPDGTVANPEDDKRKKEEEEKKREEFRKTCFFADIDDNADGILINNKRLQPCAHLSFICTNPFQVYGQKYVRLVRVIYELIPDKMKRTDMFKTYHLVRKETLELANMKGVVDEFGRPAPDKIVRKYVLIDGIRGFYAQYSARIKNLRKTEEEKQKEKDTKPSPDAPKNHTSQLWGDVFATQGIVPEHMALWLDVWNEDRTQSTRFTSLFAISAYPTSDEVVARKQNSAQNQNSNTSEQNASASQQPSGGATQPPQSVPQGQQAAGGQADPFAQALGV